MCAGFNAVHSPQGVHKARQPTRALLLVTASRRRIRIGIGEAGQTVSDPALGCEQGPGAGTQSVLQKLEISRANGLKFSLNGEMNALIKHVKVTAI